MNNVLEKVKVLRSSGKANLKDAELESDVAFSTELMDDALTDFEKARTLLQPELEAYDQQPASGLNSVQKEYYKKVAFEMADFFGMSGGVYRRKGEYAAALNMYRQGKVIEERPEFEIQSSYNTVNSIVLSVLENPSSLDQLSGELSSTLEKVQKIVEGPGQRNWWSWADYALLLLLNGDQEGAFRAYDNFRKAGALPANYQSTINVLAELRAVLKNRNEKIAGLIAKAVEFLEAEKAAL